VFIQIFDQIASALAASAPYFGLAAFLYGGGFFSHYKGRKNIETPVKHTTKKDYTARKIGLIPLSSNEANNQVPSKTGPTPIISSEAEEQVPSRIWLKWSIPVGISTTAAVLAVNYFTGAIATSDMVLGIYVPTLISIAAGLLAVLYTGLVIGNLD
jgi:hypothetical protein